MAYLEVRRYGKLRQQRHINNRLAEKGVKIRLGGGEPIRLKLGQSAVLDDYEIKLLQDTIDRHDSREEPKACSHPTFSKRKGSSAEEQNQSTQIQPDIEGFAITELLGQGGMGTVWKAKQLSTNREVALKLLGSHTSESQKAKDHFQLEVMLSARLSHPNIATIYESGLHKGNYYYVMELVEGIRLDDYVQRANLNQEQILSLMMEICNAVEHAHEKDVIHRDLKPSNILVTSIGEPHILDFGLAQSQNTTANDLVISIEEGISGTPAYMSPEQAIGRPNGIDHRTDIYSLGVILYQLLTGHLPRDMTGNHEELMERIIHQDVIPPRYINQDITASLAAILTKALACDPNKRYATISEFKEDMKHYLRGEPVQAGGVHLEVGYYIKKHMRNVFLVARIVLLMGVILMAGFVLYQYVNASITELNNKIDNENQQLKNELAREELAAQLGYDRRRIYADSAGDNQQIPSGLNLRQQRSFNTFIPQDSVSGRQTRHIPDMPNNNYSGRQSYSENEARLLFERLERAILNQRWTTAEKSLALLQQDYTHTRMFQRNRDVVAKWEAYIRKNKATSQDSTQRVK